MSKISQLAERLKSQIRQEQELLEEQTRNVLRQHEQSLRQLSSAALSTTRTAIESEINLLLKSIPNARIQIERMIRLMMLWPILLTAVLCALIVAGTWLYLPTPLFQTKIVNQKMSDGKTYLVIVNPDWTVCKINDRLYPCTQSQ